MYSKTYFWIAVWLLPIGAMAQVTIPEEVDTAETQVERRVIAHKGLYLLRDHTGVSRVSQDLEIVRQDLWHDSGSAFLERPVTGGIAFKYLDPFASDAMSGWLDSRRPVAVVCGAQSDVPRTYLQGVSGLGGGQRFGFEFGAPTGNSAQLYTKYLRTNVFGFYANEGVDANYMELVYADRDTTEVGLVTVRLYVDYQKNAMNGGLDENGQTLFEENLVSLRAAIPVIHSSGGQVNNTLRFDAGKRLSKQWSVHLLGSQKLWVGSSTTSVQNYTWDSSTVPVTLLSQTLYYEDSLQDRAFHVAPTWHSTSEKTRFTLQYKAGYRQLYSDTGGWDSYKPDSLNAVAATSTLKWLEQSAHLRYARQGKLDARLRLQFNAKLSGWNAGAMNAKGQYITPNGQWSFFIEGISSPKQWIWESYEGHSWGQKTALDRYSKLFGYAHWGAKSTGKVDVNAVFSVAAYDNYRMVNADLKQFDAWSGVYASTKLNLRGNYRHWGWKTRADLQWVSNQEGFDVPLVAGTGELFGRIVIGDKFKGLVGVKVSSFSAFQAARLQNDMPYWAPGETELQAYPWVVPYVEGQIGQLTMGVRVLNAAQGLVDVPYYAWEGVPRSDRWVQLSARWLLFN